MQIVAVNPAFKLVLRWNTAIRLEGFMSDASRSNRSLSQRTRHILRLAKKKFAFLCERSLFALAVTVSSISAAFAAEHDEFGCAEVKTTIEGIECRMKQLDAAELKLKRYFDAAAVRAKSLNLDSENLEREQSLWVKYRMEHCGNVYVFWREGTARYEMSALCNLRLTGARTYDIWAAYLTYFGTTPPVLPNPSR